MTKKRAEPSWLHLVRWVDPRELYLPEPRQHAPAIAAYARVFRREGWDPAKVAPAKVNTVTAAEVASWGPPLRRGHTWPPAGVHVWDGHHRVKAALRAGLDRVPVIEVGDISGKGGLTREYDRAVRASRERALGAVSGRPETAAVQKNLERFARDARRDAEALWARLGAACRHEDYREGPSAAKSSGTCRATATWLRARLIEKGLPASAIELVVGRGGPCAHHSWLRLEGRFDLDITADQSGLAPVIVAPAGEGPCGRGAVRPWPAKPGKHVVAMLGGLGALGIAHAGAAMVEYLNDGFYAGDFDAILPVYAKETKSWGEHESLRKRVLQHDAFADDLPEELSQAFSSWIKANPYVVAVHLGIETPAYMLLKNAKRAPVGLWCAHFASAPFMKFDRGATIERGLALSVFIKNKPRVDCAQNLTDETGLYETVYGFAFRLDDVVRMRYGQLSDLRTKYGNSLVLFRTDEAVIAYHSGDDEEQVIFPLCSERDVVPLELVPATDEDGDSAWLYVVAGGLTGHDIAFTSLRDVAAWAEAGRPAEFEGAESASAALLREEGF